MKTNCYVYQLIDPRTDDPFYVGMTRDPTKRLDTHLSGRCPCTAGAIAKLKGEGVEPSMVIIAKCPSVEYAHKLERMLIRQFREQRIPLCNNRYGHVPQPDAPQHGKPWDDNARRLVRELFQAKARLSDIARTVGRTPSGVRHELVRLGLLAQEAA